MCLTEIKKIKQLWLSALTEFNSAFLHIKNVYRKVFLEFMSLIFVYVMQPREELNTLELNFKGPDRSLNYRMIKII